MMLMPGGTPEQTIVLPFAANNVTKCIVTYSQHGLRKFEVELENFSDTAVEGKCSKTYSLTQDQTLNLEQGLCQIQVNVMSGDDRLPSLQKTVKVGPQSHPEVIDYDV